MTKWKRKTGTEGAWIKCYTIMFAVLALLVYSLHILYGKSFVYSGSSLSGDGLLQHYTALAYYGEYLRTIFRKVFVLRSFSIPEFDLSIGLGGNIITTLGYETLGDPLSLLAVFVPMRYTEYLYVFLILFRLYLAGIAFCQYCFYHSYSMEQVLPGVLIYVFSFYTIAVAILHPFFLNPLIFFPWILMGADRLIQERRMAPFVLPATLAAVSNFYFFYMITFMVFLYCIPYIGQSFFKDRDWRQGLRRARDLVLSYAVALMLAAPVLLPMAAAVGSSGRLGGAKPIPLFYELSYYAKLPIAFMNASADHYAHLGYGVTALLAVGLLLMKTKWREKVWLKAAFLTGTVFLLFPFFGSMLNGFGYATNRWVWAYCFVVAMIVVSQIPAVWKLKKWAAWGSVGATLLFMIPTFYVRAQGDQEKLAAAAIVLVAGMILPSAAILLLWKRNKGVRTFYLTVIVVNIFLSMYGFYSPLSGNYIKDCGSWGQAWEDISGGALSAMEGLNPEEYERARVDSVSNMSLADVRANSAMLMGVNSIAFYFSMIDESSASFLHEMYLPTPLENQYVNLDGRALLSCLLGVKYQIVRQGEEDELSYGYSRLVQEKNGYALYESDYALPLAFLYDSVMSEEDYETLDVVEKQQAIMQAAVLSDMDLEHRGEMPVINAGKLEYCHRDSPYRIEDAQGVTIQENRYEVTQAGAFIQLSADSSGAAERYFLFDNLWYEGADSARITVTNDVKTCGVDINGVTSNYYAGIHDFLCNMGYAGEHGDSYRLVFSRPGTYLADEIRIVDQPLGQLEKWSCARRENEVEYSILEDEIALRAEAEKDCLLYLSIPYSRGWSAMLDDQEVSLMKVNHFGMGVYIPQGEHTICLQYRTPYLRTGLILMAAGVICCCAAAAWKSGRDGRAGRKL